MEKALLRKNHYTLYNSAPEMSSGTTNMIKRKCEKEGTMDDTEIW